MITSRENKIFKTAMILKTAKGRSENKMFLIEGMRAVRDSVAKGAKLSSILVKDGTTLDFTVDCPVYTFAPKLFDNIAETVTPQGVIAVCRMTKHTLHEISENNRQCVVLCECLQDPGNIGTVIRTAHAAYCGGVVLSKGSCDLYNSKIVRSTMTSMLSVPVVQNVETDEVIEYFKNEGYTVVAGALTDNAVDFYDADLSGKHLIIIGNEGNGVKSETLSKCDKVLKIPMRSDAESLNAAVAGAVMIYEHYRQNIKIL